MKNIWKYGRTGGEYAGKVLDDMLVSVPYTDQPPLEGIRADGEPLTIADQMFDPKLNQWIVLANTLDHNDLNNLNFDDARKPIVRFIDSPTTPVKKLAVRGFALVFAPAPTENSQVKE
ncbi:hypothetical protein GT453_14830 [Enterococcus durans]|nr:hypothetical protein [Enterococcus durans]